MARHEHLTELRQCYSEKFACERDRFRRGERDGHFKGWLKQGFFRWNLVAQLKENLLRVALEKKLIAAGQ